MAHECQEGIQSGWQKGLWEGHEKWLMSYTSSLTSLSNIVMGVERLLVLAPSLTAVTLDLLCPEMRGAQSAGTQGQARPELLTHPVFISLGKNRIGNEHPWNCICVSVSQHLGTGCV